MVVVIAGRPTMMDDGMVIKPDFGAVAGVRVGDGVGGFAIII